MSAVTNELTEGDLENKINDERSLADDPTLTNNNLDRIVINCIRSKSFPGKNK